MFYPATKSLCDEKGKPLQWELKPLSTAQNEAIQDACMTKVPIKGKPNMYRPKLDSNTYLKKIICTCVVFPDLYSKELQDSYGVMTPEDLLTAMTNAFSFISKDTNSDGNIWNFNNAYFA